MKTKLQALYARYGEVFRYLIIGGVTTGLDWGVFTLMNALLGIHYQVANVTAWVVAVTVAFIGNKWVVFRTRGADGRDTLREAASFLAMRLVTLLISALFLYVTVTLLGLSEPLAKALSVVLVIILNYVLSKLVVFRRQP